MAWQNPDSNRSAAGAENSHNESDFFNQTVENVQRMVIEGIRVR